MRPINPEDRTSRTAFTLMELLVVISLIVLLIAMLTPSLKQAKRNATDTKCASNMRSSTIAFVSYAGDNQQLFPDFSYDPNTGAQYQVAHYWFRAYWRKHMWMNYGMSREMYYSPNNDRWNRDDFWIWANGNEETAPLIAGYFYFGSTLTSTSGFVSSLINPPPGGGAVFPRRFGNTTSSELLWTDLNRQLSSHIGQWQTPGDALRWGSNHYYGNSNQIPHGSHRAFTDNHVEWIKGEEMQLESTYGGTHMYW